MKIKTGDSVIVTRGSFKGQSGKVTAANPTEMTVTVAGVNVRTKHQKPTQANRNLGGIVKQEMPIPVSNVAIQRPGDTKKGTRVGFKIDDKGKKTRVARQAKDKEIK